MPEKLKNATLFLELSLLSALIRHENGAFQQRNSNRRNLKTLLNFLFFDVEGKQCLERSFSKPMD